MTLAYEDMTVANRFQRTTDSRIHPSALPNGYPFKTIDPSLVGQKSVLEGTLCGASYLNINDGAKSDPLEKLATLIESLKAPGGRCTTAPGETVACPGGYCVPYLTSQGSMHHTSCVTEAEMFPPIADTAIEVKNKDVTLNPSVAFGRPLYFGPMTGNSPASCVRVTVSAQAFTMSDVVFDQTGCKNLAPSYRVAVVYGGLSAVGSSISGLSIFGAPAPAVSYLGNSADGDSPYLTVSEDGLTDAVLKDVGFVFESADDPSEPIGLVAAMARTLGTQTLSQCSRTDCSDYRVRDLQDSCANAATCSQRGCPWPLVGPGCTSSPSGTIPCPDYCAAVLSGTGLGCTRGLANASAEYTVALDIETELVPPGPGKALSGVSTLAAPRADESGSFCIPSRWPLGQVDCQPRNQSQLWFIEDFTKPGPGPFRVHPVQRPFTCLLLTTGPDGNATSGFYPCPPCEVGTEETVQVCDGTAPTFEEAVWDMTLEQASFPEDALLIPVLYDSVDVGVAAFPNGSCLVKFPTRLWADCRTECIRDVPEEACNGTSVRPAGGLLQACVHRGSVAAILKAPCTSGGTIVQDPSGSGGAVDCFHGYYRISAHGRGYVSGPATVNGAPVTIYTSQAVIQPYDETSAVIGVGVDVFNISAATALFGRAFERNLFPSNKSTALYLVLAVVAFAVGIIALVVTMTKVAKRKQE